MQDAISARLTRLAVAVASPSASVSAKSEFLDLAKQCQVLPRNDYLVQTIAGALTSGLTALFGPASLLVPLTEKSRRQVWFATIAGLQLSRRLPDLLAHEETRIQLLEDFLLLPSADLIRMGHGSCPNGLLRLLPRLGEHAEFPQTYRNLYLLTSEVPGLAKELLSVTQNTELDSNLIGIMKKLPPLPDAPRIAAIFRGSTDYDDFMTAYNVIVGSPELLPEDRARILAGEAPFHLLKRRYLTIPFPAPVISGTGLTHISNGLALTKTAIKFKNCLRSYLPEALAGTHQYYIWKTENTPEIVLCIRNDAPFGWRYNSAGFAENEHVPLLIRRDLLRLLKMQHVRITSAAQDLFDTVEMQTPSVPAPDFLRNTAA